MLQNTAVFMSLEHSLLDLYRNYSIYGFGISWISFLAGCCIKKQFLTFLSHYSSSTTFLYVNMSLYNVLLPRCSTCLTATKPYHMSVSF